MNMLSFFLSFSCFFPPVGLERNLSPLVGCVFLHGMVSLLQIGYNFTGETRLFCQKVTYWCKAMGRGTESKMTDVWD